MSLRRGRARAELNAEINVVSLIDVMMLLLVIFMITAPIMQGGVELTLPSAVSKPLEPKSGMVVSVSRDAIWVDQTRLTDREFRAGFRSMVGSRAKDGVSLQGDASISLQRLLDVMSIIKAAGVENVGLITQPREDTGR
ncbi:MAG TPA: biopolymer transporter ExbD [Gemmatimonadaceae bacterium]|nr:biopolymer transporter ExbD [Gemmatimonadaceae bacterium]